MRSIKSELYLFIKTIILGGSYQNDSSSEIQTFNGFVYNDNGTKINVNNFAFYNSLLNEHPFLSVLFKYDEILPEIHQLKVSETNLTATIKEKVRFSLFIPYPKTTAEMIEEDYLDHLDICENIHFLVSDQRFLGISTIKKVGETHDERSEVIMGKEMIYETLVTTYGSGNLVDANDSEVNPEAPVKINVTPIIVKKVE